MFPCYNPLHQHAFPDRAFVDGLAELLPKTQAAIREANPSGVIIGEWINDFTAQWLDSSWSWRQTDFPEPVLYTLPWAMMSHEIDALEFDEVNKAFACKLHLDMKIDGGDSPVTKYPRFAEHIKSLADLRRRVADYYVAGDFRDEEGIKLAQTRKVVAKVFRNAAARKVGIVLAEFGGEKAEVVLNTQWGPKSSAIRIESNLRESQRVTPADELRLELRPYEVRVLCVDAQ
jgi:hypothetical protein